MAEAGEAALLQRWWRRLLFGSHGEFAFLWLWGACTGGGCFLLPATGSLIFIGRVNGEVEVEVNGHGNLVNVRGKEYRTGSVWVSVIAFFV